MKKYNKNLYVLLVFLTKLCFLSCDKILIEKDISDRSVTLIAPKNEAQFFSTGVTFTWNEVEDATSYQIEIAKPNFQNPLQVIIDSSVTTTTFSQQLPIGSYEWRVRAINNSYKTPYASRTLIIVSNQDFQSNTIVLTTPANNLVSNSVIQTLSWQPIIGATGYQIQIINDSNTIVLDQNTNNTSYNYTFSEGSFQWKVRASNGTENTLYSARTALIDVTPPNIPLPINPTNFSTITTPNTSFEWTRAPISGSTEKDSIYIYTNSSLSNLQSKNLATNPFTIPLITGTYYWKLKAFDASGNSSNSSTTFSFTVN
jgi:hypothetical protein